LAPLAQQHFAALSRTAKTRVDGRAAAAIEDDESGIGDRLLTTPGAAMADMETARGRRQLAAINGREPLRIRCDPP
jgi:hypothetical protein